MKTGYSKLTLGNSASNGGNFSISNNCVYVYNYDNKKTKIQEYYPSKTENFLQIVSVFMFPIKTKIMNNY